MTRCRLEMRGNRTQPAGRSMRLAAAVAASLALGTALLLVGGLALPVRAEIPKGTITNVQIIGNQSVSLDDIKSKIRQCRVGRALDPAAVETDYQTLMTSKWFSDVLISYKKDPSKSDGVILIFEVKEMPVIKSVEYRGMTKFKTKVVEEATSLKAGARADSMKAQLAVRSLKRLYEEKGYELAEIKLVKGGEPGDTVIIFEVFEGPKSRVENIEFTGNHLVSGARLRTQISTRPPILGLGGRYYKDLVEEDARKLRQYYQALGYFEVKVSPVAHGGSSVADQKLEFVIWEGPQYRVNKISFQGTKLIDESTLRAGLVLHSGQPLQDTIFEADKKKIEARYGELGCIDAQIDVERKYIDPIKQPGVVDLVYKIQEGDPYVLGDFIIKGNERTKDTVLRREAIMAGLIPGEPLNMNRVKMYESRLKNLHYFGGSGGDQKEGGGKPIDIKLINRRPNDKPYGEIPLLNPDDVIRTRMQSPGPEIPPDEERLGAGGAPVPAPAPTRVARTQAATEIGPPPMLDDPAPAGPQAAAPRVVEPLAPGPGPAQVFGSGGAFNPPPNQPVPPVTVPGPPPDLPPLPAGPVGPNGQPRTPIGQGEPPGMFPSMTGENMTDVGPDRNEPFQNRSYADLVTSVEEAPTGRFMLGAGVTSYGGISGNLIIHESNFDLFAIPRSWRELFSGQAFRGAGQDLRIELSPGTLINRYLVSFRDPYLFDLPGGYAIGFGASGYFFTRYYEGQYNEQRGGGRFSLGSQLGTSTYADFAVRVEDVDVYGFNYPAPAAYLAAEGHTFLTSLRPSLRYDNRNDPFASSKGQYLEAAFEQGFGSFTWPKFTLEGRQYFTLWNRPDGSGKHILTFRGFFGIAGKDLPVYERFYAGDFRSMRGFAYRGVGPYELGRNVGGIMSAIGSIEYQFPLIASDKLQQVVFTDFGTVEPNYQFSTFRCSVGTGLRVYLPQQMFGPLPLAFDFAVPIVKGPEDHTRLFTFFIGAFW